MNIRLAGVAVAASVLLLGCMTSGAPRGPHGGMPKDSDCNGASCTIHIVVNCDNGPDECDVTAVPKTLYVGMPRGNKTIHWMLDAPNGYAFADDGAQFGSGAPVRCSHIGSGQKQFTCPDNHQQAGKYGYTLAVVNTGDPTSRIPVDPWIVNR